MPRRRKLFKKSDANCLYVLIVLPITLAVQAIGLLLKGVVWLFQTATATPESRRFSLIAIGGVAFMSLCVSAVSAVSSIIAGSTATPTVDVQIAIQKTAQAQAFINFTQTARALPTETITATVPSNTAQDTNTPQATVTARPTATPLPTFTSVPVIIFPTSPPSGGSGAGYDHNGDGRVTCADFDYQYQAQEAYSAGYSNLDGNDNDGKACESLP